MLETVSAAGALLLLRHFSRVRLCDPTDGSPPGSPGQLLINSQHLSVFSGSPVLVLNSSLVYVCLLIFPISPKSLLSSFSEMI